MNISRTTVLACMFLAIGTGCATRGDIDSLRAEISELKQLTEQARANSLQTRKLAASNQERLLSVENTANAANAQALETDKKLDTVFEKAMQK